MQVLMLPHLSEFRNDQSGIRRVVEAYFRYLPKYGVELVPPDATSFDLLAAHAGSTGQYVSIAHCHGLYWTADYNCDRWQYHVNARVIEAVRYAREVTVPSAWVAETFQRDMRFTPHVIPHGIEWSEWQHDTEPSDFVLWNKNRNTDVCDPTVVLELANRFPKQHFVSTFLPRLAASQNNVNVIGLIPYEEMKKLVQACRVYLATTKETFGIGTLEAMAAGVPVLAVNNGGNAELVQHGVTGYLAKPGDADDLAAGLNYCLQHRDVLGANGRELAKSWTWEAACQQVAQVYEQAMAREAPTVGVVIPVYNKSEEEVRRAVESATRQTFDKSLLQSITIVDDGSTQNNVGDMVRLLIERDARIRYIRQENSGVAVARNRGIARSETKYVCCLDADDWIGPNFIAECVKELERDRSLGIVYSGLWFHTPDGGEGLSPWPGEYDFDAHLKRQNQIPTCCVFRRKMWERLGGYRQRYAPGGCGEEDAEFWLRCGAYGWNAKRLPAIKDFYEVYHNLKRSFQREPNKDEIVNNSTYTPEQFDEIQDRLFHYSWLSGQVTGNKEHRVTDWTGWHPWVEDGKHPFASMATPVAASHQVRQYDEPTVSVIIPVGPGHEEQVVNALDSLEAQTFRKWEAIVVWDMVDTLDNLVSAEKLRVSYPYIRFDYTPSDSGSKGPGFARNRGAEIARAPFVFFLDADDQLYPEALAQHVDAWNEHQAIIYSDYVGRSIVSAEHVADLESRGKLLSVLKNYDDGTHLIVSGPSGADYDCELAQQQPLVDGSGRCYIWCNVTALIPKAWHDEIGGFDESLKSWEDVDYHWRLAKAGRCYHRISEPLLVYNYHKGSRRESGRQNYENLIYLLKDKHERIEMARGCSGCGRGRGSSAVSRASARRAFAPAAQQPVVDDSDFVLVVYQHPNKGRHQVTGAAMFPQPFPGFKMIRRTPELWSIDYGRRAGGGKEKFRVHRDDIKLKPGIFVEVIERQVVNSPEPAPAPPPAPAPLVEEEPVFGPPAPEPIELPSEPEPLEVPEFNLQHLPGVGGTIAQRLREAGVDSRESLLELGLEGLSRVKGVSERRAMIILQAVKKQTGKKAQVDGVLDKDELLMLGNAIVK